MDERVDEGAVEPVTATPARPVGRTVFTQVWSQLSFLHWAVEPERVQPYLPPGIRPDTFDGVSYVGLVPFLMRDIGALGGPGIPYFGSFCETNIRLYSVDPAGRRGVVFVSLDASRLATVLAARWGPGLPYLWSGMSYRRDGDVVRYDCRRRWPISARPPSPTACPRGASSRIALRVGEPVEAGPLEHFLTARWGLHLAGPATARPSRRTRAYYWPNVHEQWPLHAATLEDFGERDGVLAAGGFGDLAGRTPDSVLFSPGVHAVFGPSYPADRPR